MSAAGYRLSKIQDQMFELLEEARNLIRWSDNKSAYARADAYWLAHIESALTKEGHYLGSSMVTMDSTIEELGGSDDPDDTCSECEEPIENCCCGEDDEEEWYDPNQTSTHLDDED